MAIQKNRPPKKVVNVLNQSLKSIFGDTGAFALCHRLEKGHMMKLEDIIEKPEVFVRVLKEIFGETGAEIVEALLLKDLYFKLGVKDCGDETSSLSDCFEKLKAIH